MEPTSSEETGNRSTERTGRRRSQGGIRLTLSGFLFLIAIDLLVLVLLAFPFLRERANRSFSFNVTATPTSTPSQTAPAPPSDTPVQSTLPSSAPPTTALTPEAETTSTSSLSSPLERGTLILSLGEGGFYHLFAYQPMHLPLTRLSSGDWNDITPAISPDHTQVAFASNRSGYWDIYLLNLSNGEIQPLTNTPEYDAAPTWSPDGRFLAYETYLGDNLEIVILPLAEPQEPILLSDHPAADYSPCWSPQGRTLAFVSTRSGQAEVWLADLDKAGEERFTNLSQTPLAVEAHPLWSPDGSTLAWASLDENGAHNLVIYRENQANVLGSGDWAAWSPDGSILATVLREPNQNFLTAYTLERGLLALPPISLPGSVQGLTWADAALPSPLPAAFAEIASLTPTPLWLPALTPVADIPGGRQHLVKLQDVEAPYPMLHDLVDESFQALRKRVASAIGWDFLATLENAYLPLTAPLPPGLANDWLQTARAVALNTLPMTAGWMAVVPEAYGSQTTWRVYLRTLQQDGSQGMPLHETPWDFQARYNGNPVAYEQGGAPMATIPPGYWVDFTEIAAAYGWERLPALVNWRTYYHGARFNQFVFSGGLDWRSAMLELYPPEALITPTVIIPPTLTPTPLPLWLRSATPPPTSPSPTQTLPTPTPTATPTPPLTTTPTRTPSATRSPTALP
jgi:TolB protein